MEGSRFRLAVQDVFAAKAPGVVVTGVVEGGSISVGDLVQLHRSEGKCPKARVEAIEAGLDQRVHTAEPGGNVGLLLRGIRKEQIGKGDILETPEQESRLLKGLKTFDVVILILAIVVVGNLLYSGVCLLFGWQDEKQEFLRQTAGIAAVNIALFLGIVACDSLSKRFWRRKNERDDWDAEFRVLKCTPQAYALLIAGVFLLLLLALMVGQATAEELQAAWDSGALAFPILFVVGYNLLAIPSFLYYTRQKVFYSRYQLRVAGFWRRCDIPWARIRSITLIPKKKKSRLVLTVVERNIVLRSEVLANGWDDFVDFVRRMAREYRIPFEGQ